MTSPTPSLNPSADSRPRWIVPLLVAAAVAVAVLYAWELFTRGPIAIDDAYITFSFSRNLAMGHGPVYGHGVRVEGYSNFLWMLVMALGLVFQTAADPIIVARIMGVPFALMLGFATYELCRLRASRAWAFAALAMCAINLDVIAALIIGLETLAFTALLALGFAFYLTSIEPARDAEDAARRARRGRWVVPLMVAVALTRIDGFIPLGFVLAFEAARRLARRKGTLRDYARWAGPALAVYAAWFAWRWAYYGLPLPTTYYAKQLIPKLLPHRGLDYIVDEMKASGAFLALPFALVVLARRRLTGLFVVSFVALHLLYVMRTGGDWMPYGRFLLPIYPLLMVIVVWGGADLVALARPRAGRAAAALHLLPLAMFIVVARRTEPHMTDVHYQIGKLYHTENEHVRSLKMAARLLNRAMAPGARLVTDYGGVLAYYTDAAPIEMWGLCNAAIATRGGAGGVNGVYGKTCPSCYPELDPEFFHTLLPLVRDARSLHSHGEVVRAVWQTDTIGHYLDFRHGFIAGRVNLVARGEAVFFLEKRKPGAVYQPRPAGDGVIIDYPFEPGGRSPGL